MCMMLNIPPAIESQVPAYEKAMGKSVEQVLIDYLAREFAAMQERQQRVRRFRELVARQTPLAGKPYQFHRQDAHDEELG